jgi:hypothetical protein
MYVGCASGQGLLVIGWRGRELVGYVAAAHRRDGDSICCCASLLKILNVGIHLTFGGGSSEYRQMALLSSSQKNAVIS